MVEHISNKSKLLTSCPNTKMVWLNATQDVMGLTKDFHYIVASIRTRWTHLDTNTALQHVNIGST